MLDTGIRGGVEHQDIFFTVCHHKSPQHVPQDVIAQAPNLQGCAREPRWHHLVVIVAISGTEGSLLLAH